MANISVIVPVYKVEAYLGRCVDSILSQTYPDFELILVDDGSPDRCGELCDGYARQDSRVHVIHQANGGLSAARNAGIDWAFANSNSRWLAFVDSDDWVAPEYLYMLFRAAEEMGCALSVCGIQRTTGEPLPPAGAFAAKAMYWDDYYCSTTIHGGVTVVAWNKLYRKGLFTDLRYPLGRLHEDEFTTYLAACLAGRVAVVETPLYAYFQNDGGIMRSKWDPRRMHSLDALEEQIRFAKDKDFDQLLRKAVKQYVYTVSDQLRAVEAMEEYGSYKKVLQKRMAWALAAGRECGMYPLCWENLWAYELAYPMKAVWWLAFKIKARLGK